jgi:hypothetical protein
VLFPTPPRLLPLRQGAMQILLAEDRKEPTDEENDNFPAPRV